MSKNKRVKLIICVSVLLILSTVIGAFSAYSYKESKAFTETTTVPTTVDKPENKTTAKTTEALLLQELTTEEIITEPKKVSESTVDDSEKCIMKIVVTKNRIKQSIMLVMN